MNPLQEKLNEVVDDMREYFDLAKASAGKPMSAGRWLEIKLQAIINLTLEEAKKAVREGIIADDDNSDMNLTQTLEALDKMKLK